MRKSAMLRRLLARPGVCVVAGANDGMSALLAKKHGFDALWASGLAISTAHGVPDMSILTMTEFLNAAAVMNQATTIPVIADCDTGFGEVNNVIRMVRQYEQANIAGVCIEDKVFPKRNSFLDQHQLADVHEFAAKIKAAKRSQTDPDFIVIARLESLIAGYSMEDAVARAIAYSEAGADAILVHSKAKTPDEVLEFAREWQRLGQPQPLVVVPTTYFTIDCSQLKRHGIKMVIYANQALRATIQAINSTLSAIRVSGTSAGVESKIASVKEVFSLVGTEQIDETDIWYRQVVEQMTQAAAAKREEVRR